jgi:hypothetical protein
MNDEELAAAVKEAVRGAHMNVPAEQIVHRSRAIRARRRIPALAGGLSAAAAATAAALVLTSGPVAVLAQHGTTGHAQTIVTAAWTVREEAGGTVKIYLRQYANPAGLQQTLRADGINAIVRRVPVGMRTITPPMRVPGSGKSPLRVPGATCRYATTNNAPPRVQRAVVTLAAQDFPELFIVHADAMPQGSALLLPFLTGMPTSAIRNPRVKPQLPVVLNNDTVPACVPFIKPGPPSAAPEPNAKQ